MICFHRIFCSLLVGSVFGGLVGCTYTESPSGGTSVAPRPVTVFPLEESTPQRNVRQPGTVSSWKTEEIGFQVSGRVRSVLEPGAEIRGQTFDELGRPISAGTVIARLEEDRFQLKLAGARARLKTTQAQANAKESELKKVIPARINASRANVTLATAEFERVQKLVKREAATQADFDKAKAEVDRSNADLEQMNASQAVAEAELESLNAQTQEAAESVKAAEKDLADTQLISAYDGQIAGVHQIAGSFVQAGERVVTVQMMDPMMVEIAVAAQTEARLNFNDVVYVYLPDDNVPVEGMVYEKAAMADAATRTFDVTLLVRNERNTHGAARPGEDRQQTVHRIRAMWRLFTESTDRMPPYYINVDALHTDSTGSYVWKVVNRAVGGRSAAGNASELKLRKVAVVPGDKRIPFLQVATLRELADIGELEPERDLIAGAFTDERGDPLPDDESIPPDVETITAYHVRQSWRLRPGNVVQVDLAGEQATGGFYVPTNVIAVRGDKYFVFIVEGEVARRVAVNVFDSVGTLRRIESVDDGGLSAGMKVVADGALFVSDGESVNIVEELEAPE